MVQCYAGDDVRRDTALLESLERETIMNGIDAAVDVGIDGLWAPNHFTPGPHAEEYEVWTRLSALAERTDGVDIGPLVGSIAYRNSALLAKMATTVDDLSEGRLRLGLGASWHEEEHAAYGFDFPDVDARIDMLDDGIQVVKTMFTEDEQTFRGEHFEIENALNEPKQVSDPRPPIVVGGGRSANASPRRRARRRVERRDQRLSQRQADRVQGSQVRVPRERGQ